MRILIIKTSSLGDIIHALPAVNLLVKHIPDAEIDWLVKPEFANVLRYCPNLDEMIFFDRKKFASLKYGIKYCTGLIKYIRKKKYDIVIDFQGLMRSALFAGLADAEIKAGFAAPREFLSAFFYNRRVKADFKHVVDRNLALVREVLGCKIEEENDKSLFELLPCDEFAVSAEKILNDAGRDSSAALIAVVPGADWKSKKFPCDFFVDIMERIHVAVKADFMLIGGENERKDAEKIENIAALSNMKIINCIGRASIGESIELLRRADIITGNDSGPMRIGAAMGVPLCVFAGSSRPENNGPYSSKCRIFRNERCSCSGCLRRECPHEPDILCHRIDIENVADYIIREISKNN